MELTEDQIQFGEVVERFMADKSPPTVVRKLMATEEGYDPAVWKQLCEEVGLAGTHIPEEYGGFGFSDVELAIAAAAMGKHLFCGPFFSSAVMAGCAILEGGTDENKEALLPGIAAGTTIATLVLDSLDKVEEVGQKVTADGDVLSGQVPIVIDAHIADTLIVITADGNGYALFSIDKGADGVSVRLRESIDETRKTCEVTFTNAKANRIGSLDIVGLNRLWDRLVTFLTNEMIGGAKHLLETTVEFTKMRFQFGRPIGSFQGLKHRCADLLMELELAKASAEYAALCYVKGTGEPYVASMAKNLAGDAYTNIAIAGVQLRGGLGFTWEEDTHLWFKRAKGSEVLLGTPHYHRERMMTIIEEAS